MATATIYPSSYTLSNTTYSTISNPSNMYTGVSSSTYATFTHNRASTSYTYYLYLTGFNFSGANIPANATINSFTIRIKASGTGLNTGSGYRMGLYNGSTSISNTTVSSALSSTATTFTFPNGSLTWDTLSSYTNFRIRVPLRRSSSNTAATAQIYGAQIDVDYTAASSTHTITLTNNTTDTYCCCENMYDGNWTTQKDIDDGHYFHLIIEGNLNGLYVTDNDVDVTSSLEYSEDEDGSNIYDYYIYRNYSVHEDHTLVVSHSSPQTTYTVTASTTESDWTVITSADECNGIIGAGRGCMVYILGSDFTNLHVTDNGVDITSSLIYVPEETGEYSQPAYYYFSILNIQTNHTIVVSGVSGPSQSIYLKSNGSWLQTTKVYKKSNNTWVEQNDYSSLFSNNDIWIKV